MIEKQALSRWSRKIAVLILLTVAVLTGCVAKGDAIKKQLIRSMEENLNKTAERSTHASFEVLDVNYFDDKVSYQCEFKVRMKEDGRDTTGVMAAQVSRDYREIKRKR